MSESAAATMRHAGPAGDDGRVLFAVIVGCEVGFWVLVGAGLGCRYLLRRRRESSVLLAAVPVLDLVLLAATMADL